MKKIIILLVLLLCLAGCGTSEDTSTSTTIDTTNLNEEIVEYFDEYDCFMSMGGENGYVYCFDDGTDNGVALVLHYDDTQKEEVANLDIMSDTYFEDIETIAKQSNDFDVVDLNELAPTTEELDKYIGQEMGVMFDDGYEEFGYSIDDTSATFSLQNDKYCVDVTVEGTIDEDDLSTNYERSLIVSNVTFTYLSDEYFYTLIDGE